MWVICGLKSPRGEDLCNLLSIVDKALMEQILVADDEQNVDEESRCQAIQKKV